MAIVLVGLGVILLSLTINIWQLQPGIRAVAELNEGTRHGNWTDLMLYPFRFICILPKLLGPIVLDILVVGIGGTVGLGGGVVGFILGISASCMLSIAIKISIAVNKHSAKRRLVEEA